MTPKQLDAMITSAVSVTGGTMPMTMLVATEKDATELRAALKRRRNTKTLTVRVASTPDELLPMAKSWRNHGEEL